MWSKGAVVIVKYGDEEMANSMVDGIRINLSEMPKPGTKDIKTLEVENYFLRCCVSRLTKDKIDRARDEYGNKSHTPAWIKKISEWVAFVVYCFSTFIEKVMRRQE